MVQEPSTPQPPAVSPGRAARIQAARQRLAASPGDPVLTFQLGVELARAADRDEALAMLERVVETRAGIDPDGTAYDAFKDEPRYRALLARIRHDCPAVGTARIAFEIPEPDLVPEGIAYDPDSDSLFVGSLEKKKILRIAHDGTVRQFVAPHQEGLQAVIGLRVDSRRGLLWVASSFGERPDEPPESQRSGLFAFRLDSGRLDRRVLLDAGPQHLLNDIVVTRAGEVYATDTSGNALFRLLPGKVSLDRVPDGGQLRYPNGIAVSPDDTTLFVATSTAIVAVNPRTMTAGPLRHPDALAVGGIDGLYWYGDGLIGVQNAIHPGRLVRYRLSRDMTAVESAAVIEAYHPLFEEPTTAAVVGDRLFVLANPQLTKWADGGPRRAPLSAFRPVVILETDLRRPGYALPCTPTKPTGDASSSARTVR